jgi:hypothetical protein
MDTSKAEVKVVPLESDTGRSIYLMLTVTDFGGGQGEIYTANGELKIKIDVINLNDPPKFVEYTIMPDLYTEPLIKNSMAKLDDDNAAFEDEEFKILVKAEDPDIGVEPNEKLTYGISALTEIDGTLDIEPDTGVVTFLPTNADVGIAAFVVSVTDWQDEKVEHDFEVEVKNSNDAPMDAVIVEPTLRTFTTEDKIDFKGECHDDDLDIASSDEVLTFMWYTNRSSELLGMDSEIYGKKLSAGLHKITLKVIDVEGEIAEDSIELVVTPVNIGPDPDNKNDTDDKDDDDDKKSDVPGLENQGDDKGVGTVFLAILAAIIVAVVIALIIFGVIKPRKKKDETAEVENLEQQQQLPQIPVMPVQPYPGMPMQPYPGMYQMPYGVQTPYGVQPQMAAYPQAGQPYGMQQPGLPAAPPTAQPVTPMQPPVAEPVKIAGVPQTPEPKTDDPGATTVEAQKSAVDPEEK